MLECFYCGREIHDGRPPKRGIIDKLLPPPTNKDWAFATRDHIIPKSRGGGLDPTIVWCCMECNQEKGALTIEEYRVVKAFRYGYISRNLSLLDEFKFHGEYDVKAKE